MIYGIVAAEAETSIAPTPALPTAIASADFVNAVYTYSGSGIALSSLTSDPGHRSASGLVIGPLSNIIGSFFTLLDTLNWTFVAKFVPNSAAFAGGYNVMFVEGYHTVNADYCSMYMQAGVPHFYDQNDAGSPSRSVTDSNSAIVNVVNKVACTRTNAEAAFSINGHAVVRQLTSLTNCNTDTFAFCDSSGTSAGYIQKVDIYAPQNDSMLPLLSA